ncbi:hypothetical protein SH139x_001696 [Planctomycetaceae bacterium SH139]
MTNLQTLAVWAFGMACAVIMLGSLVKRRRESLVTSLREHVESRIGKTIVEDEPPAENDETTSE